MSLSAIAFVLGSAGVHAFWNLIYKNANDKVAFAFWKTGVGVILLTALALGYGARAQPIDPEVYLRATVSGIAYALFFIFMSASYEAGDFSLVYPITRGSGPALAVVGGVVLLHERISVLGTVGVALVLGAIVVISLFQGNGRGGGSKAKPVFWALLVGLTISIYSVNDAVAVKQAHPFYFLWLAVTLSLVIQAPYVLKRQGARETLAVLRRDARLIAVAGVLDLTSYCLFLFALRLAPTAYVTPMRSASVVIGAILGAAVLKESQASLRIACAAVVTVGVALVAWKG